MTTLPSEPFDVLVIGAGPAGLAAVAELASRGIHVALIDAEATPGGQYWRQPMAQSDGLSATLSRSLQHDLPTYDVLTAWPKALGDRYFAGYRVWAITGSDGAFEVHAVWGSDDQQVTLAARRLVLAPGAYDRQLPFPGWDLPGVITAGGAQALLKGHQVAAGERAVVAGTGPFLLPVATALAAWGATVRSVYDSASAWSWLPHWRAILKNTDKIVEAAEYARGLARERIGVHPRSVVVAAHGDTALEAVTVAKTDRTGNIKPDTQRIIDADLLAVGWGFTPQAELPLALGCETQLDDDGSHACRVDEHQRSSVAGVWVAGEACGIGGAALAVIEGAIAGASAAGITSIDDRLLRDRAAKRLFATAMHAAHPVPQGWIQRLQADTVVCRCEETTAGELREAVAHSGVADARGAKLNARTGMGWCQGRVCGFATSRLISEWTGHKDSQLALSKRPVALPVRMGSLDE